MVGLQGFSNSYWQYTGNWIVAFKICTCAVASSLKVCNLQYNQEMQAERKNTIQLVKLSVRKFHVSGWIKFYDNQNATKMFLQLAWWWLRTWNDYTFYTAFMREGVHRELVRSLLLVHRMLYGWTCASKVFSTAVVERGLMVQHMEELPLLQKASGYVEVSYRCMHNVAHTIVCADGFQVQHLQFIALIFF